MSLCHTENVAESFILDINTICPQ